MKTHISKITGKEVMDYANKILIDAKLDKTSNKEIRKNIDSIEDDTSRAFIEILMQLKMNNLSSYYYDVLENIYENF